MTPPVTLAKVPDDLPPVLDESPPVEVERSDEEPAVIELELPRGRFPITLKVTVNGSLFGLVNFRLRAPETSFADKVLSGPRRVL